MRKSLPSLTSLRFFSSAAIVIQHATPYFKIGETFTHQFILIQAVTFFFVLSGFILTYNYPKLDEIHDALKFVWARISRIFPAHLLTTFLFSLFFVGHDGYRPSFGQTAANITLTQAWHSSASYYFSF